MSIRLIALASLVAGASIVAVSAHSYGGQSAAAAPTTDSAFASHMCGASDGQRGPASDHHAHLAAMLGLSGDQQANIERITNDACAAMAKYHEQILAELTPEQRAKVQALHGHGSSPSSFHRLMMKLHGG